MFVYFSNSFAISRQATACGLDKVNVFHFTPQQLYLSLGYLCLFLSIFIDALSSIFKQKVKTLF